MANNRPSRCNGCGRLIAPDVPLARMHAPTHANDDGELVFTCWGCGAATLDSEIVSDKPAPLCVACAGRIAEAHAAHAKAGV